MTGHAFSQSRWRVKHIVAHGIDLEGEASFEHLAGADTPL